jgi:hypothetical protein
MSMVNNPYTSGTKPDLPYYYLSVSLDLAGAMAGETLYFNEDNSTEYLKLRDYYRFIQITSDSIIGDVIVSTEPELVCIDTPNDIYFTIGGAANTRSPVVLPYAGQGVARAPPLFSGSSIPYSVINSHPINYFGHSAGKFPYPFTFPLEPMTSNITDDYVAIASSTYNNIYYPYLAFDANINTWWHSNVSYNATTGELNDVPAIVPRYVSFVNVKQQYMSAPSTSFNISTNGGFTTIARVRFTGNIAYERIFDGAVSAGNGVITYGRFFTNNSFFFDIFNGTTSYSLSNVGTIVQDRWTTIVARYTKSSSTMQLIQDGVVVGTLSSLPTLTDRTTSMNYIAKDTYPGGIDYTSNMDYLGMMVYDRSLSDAEIATCTNIINGIEPTTSAPATPKFALYISELSALTLNASVTSWGAFTQTGSNCPQLGIRIPRYVTFIRSVNQYMSAPTTTYNISTNGGFTVVALFRFTNSSSVNERVIQFASNISLGRYNSTTQLRFQITDEMIYPITPMTSDSSDGYVASASSVNSIWYAYRAFDNIKSGSNFWHSAYINTYNPTTGVYIGTVSTIADGSPLPGEWLQIQFPTAAVINSFSIQPRTEDVVDARAPRDFSVVASNDGSTWTVIYSASGIVYDRSPRRFYLPIVPIAYSYYRLITHVVSIGDGVNRNSVVITDWALENLGSVSGGTIVQDKWTIVSARYTLADNSLTLFQDNTLIATTILSTGVPDSTLAINYIARSLTSEYANMDLLGLMVYDRSLTNPQIATCVNIIQGLQPTSSAPVNPKFTLYLSSLSSLSMGQPVSTWNLFTQTGSNRPTISELTSLTTTVSGSSINGEWLQIALPRSIRVASFSLTGRTDGNLYLSRSPRQFVIAGSNDQTTWTTVYSASNVTWSTATQKFTITDTTIPAYRYFRLITQAVGNPSLTNRDSVQIGNWSLTGIDSGTEYKYLGITVTAADVEIGTPVVISGSVKVTMKIFHK